MSIEVRNITKIYGSQRALDNVSFELHEGDVTGFIGPNGAGKSTMMKIITCFLPQNEGEVLVHGMNTVKESLEIRKIIGYLPENNPLYPDMYIKEYLEFVAGIYKLGSKTSVRVSEVIDMTGLGLERNKKIGQLSRGYKQRVGMAQALIHDPKVLILDEPTSGLDPNQILEIRNLISTLGKHKTIMLSTHIMQEVEAICNRIIIINKGSIVASDNNESIYAHLNNNQLTILVEFNTTVTQKAIESISDVEKAMPMNNNNWLIQAKAGKDIRQDVFNFAVRERLTVLSMHKQEKSLEEVFRTLTK